MQTSELFEQFKRERRFITNVTAKTLSWYETAWAKFGPFIGEVRNEGELKLKIKAAMVAMSSQGTLSPESINTYTRVCQTFINWLHENDVISKPIKLTRLKTPKLILETLTDDQIERLIKFVPRTRSQRRIHAATILMLDTGLRASEWLGLRKENIDFENKQLRVFGKGRKERLVPISAECRKALMKWMIRDVPKDAEVIFCTKAGKKTSQRNSLRDIKRLGARCGVWKIGLHYCRHSFASAFIRSGGGVTDLQKILGHSSITTTMRYTHSLIGELKIASQKFSPIARLG